MFLKKKDHALIMARLRASQSTDSDSPTWEEEGELRIAEFEEPVEAEAHFTISFDETNKPILSQV